MGAIGGLIGGLTTGQRTDPAYLMQQAQQAEEVAYNYARSQGLGQPEALALAKNPAAMKQLFGQQLQSSELQMAQRKLNRPIQVPFGTEFVNPDTAQPINTEGGGGIKPIVDSIVSGRQPPTLTGLYRQGPAVRAGLEKEGFDLGSAQLEWERAKKAVSTLNGPQMTRFVGLAKSVDSTINEALSLADEMKLSGIPLLNAAELKAYTQTQGNSPNGQLATRYITVINTLKEEFANLANGGYAPTEPAWKLANDQINANYGDRQLSASLKEIQRLINYRLKGIPNIETLGPGAGNRYTGQPAPTPDIVSPPATVPPPAIAPPASGGWSAIRRR